MSYLEFCTKEQLRDFYAEFDATEESVKTDVRYLIEWMEKQPHLPSVKDEQLLANFLLRGKNSIEKTKKLIDNYYTARARVPTLFENRSNLQADYVIEAREFMTFLPVPKLTPDGHRVMICHIFERREKDIPPAENLMKCMQIIFDICLKVDQVRGVILIYNFENVTMAFISSMLTVIKQLVMVQNKINPIRYNKIYILNLSSVAQPILNLASLIIKKQLDKLVIWKKRNEDLVEVLPKECLPEEYGGTEKSIRKLREQFFVFTQQYQDWLTSEENVKADLSRKICDANSPNSEELNGSFRKLCID